MPAKRSAVLSVLLVLLAGAAASASDGTVRSLPYATAVGDLNGDGAADTISTEYSKPLLEVSTVGAIMGYQRTVTARSGRDAAVLWSSVIDQGDLLPARLGSGHGVLVVDGPSTDALCECSVGAWIDDPTMLQVLVPRPLSVRALSGAGAIAWERTFTPPPGAAVDVVDADSDTGIASYERRPSFGGLLSATPGAADDILVQETSRTQVGEDATTTARISVLDGATGQTAVAFDVGAGPRPPAAFPAGDLDGDGLDDVLVAHAPSRGTLSAYAGGTGALLWSALGEISRYFFVSALDDVTGDGRAEVAVSGELDFVSGTGYRAAVLDGATGVRLTTDPAGFRFIGDVDRDGDSELLRLSSREISGRRFVVDAAVVDLSGRILRQDSYVSPPADGLRTELVGDLDADGIQEVAYRLEHRTAEGSEWTGAVLSGATLDPLFAGEVGEALDVRLDERGQDLALVRKEDTRIAVIAQAGNTGDVLWERRFPIPQNHSLTGWAPWRVEAADVSGDGHPDVIVNVQFQPVEEKKDFPGVPEVPDPEQLHQDYATVLTWALDGRTGEVLWSL